MLTGVCSLSSDLLSGHADRCVFPVQRPALGSCMQADVCVPCLATCSRVMQAGVRVCSLSSDLLSGHAGRLCFLSSDLLSDHAGRCVCVCVCSLSSDLLLGHAGWFVCVCVLYLSTCSWVMQTGVHACVFSVQRPALGSYRRVCVLPV